MQYLFSPTREASDSEHDDGVNGESDDELSKRTDAPVAEDVGDSSSRKRRTTTRKEAHRHFRGAEPQVIEIIPFLLVQS